MKKTSNKIKIVLEYNDTLKFVMITKNLYEKCRVISEFSKMINETIEQLDFSPSSILTDFRGFSKKWDDYLEMCNQFVKTYTPYHKRIMNLVEKTFEVKVTKKNFHEFTDIVDSEDKDFRVIIRAEDRKAKKSEEIKINIIC